MKHWRRQSHFKGLWECPDFFELPVDGDTTNIKWVLHGGSADYFIGSFDGKKFTAELPKLNYSERKEVNGSDVYLYAAESFSNMPDNRRVQMAWGHGVEFTGMPFTQVMLFPTEFSLITTTEGIRLVANPIKEIDELRSTSHKWSNLTVEEANKYLSTIKPCALDVKITFKIKQGDNLHLRYQGCEILNLSSDDVSKGDNTAEILIDNSLAEIFINHGRRYFIRNFKALHSEDGLVFDSYKYGPTINNLEIYTLKSIWNQ